MGSANLMPMVVGSQRVGGADLVGPNDSGRGGGGGGAVVGSFGRRDDQFRTEQGTRSFWSCFHLFKVHLNLKPSSACISLS